MQPKRLIALLAGCVMVSIIACNQPKETSPTATVANQDAKKTDLVKSFYPMLEKGDWGGIGKMLASDFTDHNAWVPAAGVAGRDTAISALKGMKEAFPDLKYE